MSIRIVEFKDLNGEPVFVNPASVYVLSNWIHFGPDGECNVAQISGMNYCQVVDATVLEAREKIWGSV